MVVNIENTSWKVQAYSIYARFVDISGIERMSAAIFDTKNNECINTVQVTGYNKIKRKGIQLLGSSFGS